MTISETTVREFETALLALDRLTASRLLTAPEGGKARYRVTLERVYGEKLKLLRTHAVACIDLE